MPLSSKDVNLILNLLHEDTCGSLWTFEQICRQFQQNISEHDYLHAGNAFVLLLQNRDLLPSIQQRLIIFFLFIIMYPIDPQTIDSHPFAPVFLSILQTHREQRTHVQKHFHWKIPSVTSHERSFVFSLLFNGPNEYLSKTPNQILQHRFTGNDAHEQTQYEIYLATKLNEKRQDLSVHVQCHLPVVINDPNVNQV
jgi:hypothetical protein